MFNEVQDYRRNVLQKTNIHLTFTETAHIICGAASEGSPTFNETSYLAYCECFILTKSNLEIAYDRSNDPPFQYS